jgi:lipopolysaccharide/colanic/teichoic acid biosynthesis glycosyltransferase
MYALFGKRIFDILLLIATTPVTLVLMACVATTVRVCLGSPVLFRQTRVQKGGQLFTIYKFRTMSPAPNNDPRAVRDEQRLGPVGRFLRSASLDELPQMWNILRGDMSFVGPRPMPDIYVPRYTPRERLRHSVPQGLTGWSQINGRNARSWDERFAQDVWYVENRSFGLDLKILLLTFGKVLSRAGINQPGESTCQEFLGHQ